MSAEKKKLRTSLKSYPSNNRNSNIKAAPYIGGDFNAMLGPADALFTKVFTIKPSQAKGLEKQVSYRSWLCRWYSTHCWSCTRCTGSANMFGGCSCQGRTISQHKKDWEYDDQRQWSTSDHQIYWWHCAKRGWPLQTPHIVGLWQIRDWLWTPVISYIVPGSLKYSTLVNWLSSEQA